MTKKNKNKAIKKRNKIIAIIGWVSVITSIPWVIGASVITTKFNKQRQITNQLKSEKEQSKIEDKQLDVEAKILEEKKQISIEHIKKLHNDNREQKIEYETTKLHKKIKKLEDQTKQLKALFALIDKTSSPVLVKEIENIIMVKNILDKFVTISTNEITKTPSQVSYTNWADFISKIDFTFTKDQLEAFEKVGMLVYVFSRGHDDSQTLIFNIHLKGKTVIKSTIEITGFKSQAQAKINNA